MDKSDPKTVVISTLDNSGKESLPILLLETRISISITKQVNFAIIDADAYCTAWKLKRAQVFAVSMRDLEYLVDKEARLETDPRTVV